jgi:hypothetical protein
MEPGRGPLVLKNENYKGTYDFIYLPNAFKVILIYFLCNNRFIFYETMILPICMNKVDLCTTFPFSQTNCIVGYAFINMTNP